MAHELSPEERETHLTMTASNREEWEVFTDDPYWQRRIEGLDIQPFEVRGTGRRYRLRADQILIRKGKPAISEQTRQARAARLQTASGTGVLQANRA